MRVDPTELLAVADHAVDLVVPRLRSVDRTETIGSETKSSATDFVTEHDRWSETTIEAAITAARPDDGMLGEEGARREGTTGVVWLVDPIDGTTNFVYDLPGSAVSVAARVHGTTVAGVVHDLVRDERFRATRGGGSTLDGREIRPSSETSLATALIATGFSYDSARRRAQAEALVEILPWVRDIRRFGGAAIDLCSVACGRVDGYYERGLHPWDHAAGALIAEEAGALVDDRTTGGGALVLAAPGVAEALFALVEGSGAHTA